MQGGRKDQVEPLLLAPEFLSGGSFSLKNGEIGSIVETLPEVVAILKWLPEGCWDPEASRKMQSGRKEQVEPLLRAPEFLSGGSFSQQNGEIGSIVEIGRASWRER